MIEVPDNKMAPLMRRIVELIDSLDDPVILDVGAFDGWHTRAIQTAARGRGRYHMVEPERDAPFELNPGLIWHRVAAAEFDGQIVWHASTPTHPGSGSICPPDPRIFSCYPGIDFQPSSRPCRRLDGLLRDCGVDHVDVLWMDVQGGELPALAGLGGLLDTIRLATIEVHAGEYEQAPTRDAIDALLAPHGLRPDDRGDYNPVWTRV